MIDQSNNFNNYQKRVTDENLLSGWVKIYRSLQNKSWYRKSDFVHLFIHLILNATHSGFETWFNGSRKILKPGQLITGRKKLSAETGINESKIERILKTFEKEQQIEQLTTSGSRLISIINWNIYQVSEQPNEQRMNNDRTTDEQRMNTIQEGSIKKKNEKKDESVETHSQFFKNGLGKYTTEDQDYYKNFTQWVKKNCPGAANAKKTMTIDDFFTLITIYPNVNKNGPGTTLIKKAFGLINEWGSVSEIKGTVFSFVKNWIERENTNEELIKLRNACHKLTGNDNHISTDHREEK